MLLNRKNPQSPGRSIEGSPIKSPSKTPGKIRINRVNSYTTSRLQSIDMDIAQNKFMRGRNQM